jgi:hypothetical protein
VYELDSANSVDRIRFLPVLIPIRHRKWRPGDQLLHFGRQGHSMVREQVIQLLEVVSAAVGDPVGAEYGLHTLFTGLLNVESDDLIRDFRIIQGSGHHYDVLSRLT